MARQAFAPAPTQSPSGTGASVLPGVPLPGWALPAGMPAPLEDLAPADPVEPVEAAHPTEPAALPEPAEPLTSVAESDTAAEQLSPAPAVLADLPELGDAAWDAPPPPPHPGSHRFLPAAEPAADPARPHRTRLVLLLGLAAALVLAAVAAFVSPGFLTSTGSGDPAPSVPATLSASTPAAPVDSFAAWAQAMRTSVAGVTKVKGLPEGTAARCGSATVAGVAGSACAFRTAGSEGVVWYPEAGLKAASQRVAEVATGQAR